jgi:hypothetical protein
VVVNTSFRIAPWADALYAMDDVWWKTHIEEVRTKFKGARYSVNNLAKHYDCQQLPKPFTSHGNSGAGAIRMAASGGAARIILLGYDMKHGDGGKRHWHADHPRGLGNADVVNRWPAQFKKLHEALPEGVEIINCSRETALDLWPKRKLEDVL